VHCHCTFDGQRPGRQGTKKKGTPRRFAVAFWGRPRSGPGGRARRLERSGRFCRRRRSAYLLESNTWLGAGRPHSRILEGPARLALSPGRTRKRLEHTALPRSGPSGQMISRSYFLQPVGRPQALPASSYRERASGLPPNLSPAAGAGTLGQGRGQPGRRGLLDGMGTGAFRRYKTNPGHAESSVRVDWGRPPPGEVNTKT